MEVLDKATPLRVELTPPKDSDRMALGAQTALEIASTIEIDSQETANDLSQLVKDWKKNVEGVNVLYDKLVEPAKQIIETARQWFKPSSAAYESAISIARSKLNAYTIAQEQRAREILAEQERLRIAKAEAAQREAANRRATAQAESERIIKQANDAAALAATKTGKAASNATGKSAELFEQAQQVLEQGERDAHHAVAAAASVVIEPPPAVKVAGFSSRKNWIAELKTGTSEEQAKMAIISAIVANRPELVACLDLNMKSIKSMAKALENNFNVPGFTARNAPVGVSR
jgi:hypothetical protein